VQKSIAAAIQNTPGRRPCATLDGRGASIASRRLLHHEHWDDERRQEGDPPAHVQHGRQRQRADQHDVADAGGQAGLGQRDRAALAVVVGEGGLDRREE